MNKKLLILSAICAVLLVAGLVTKRQPQQSITEQASLVDLFPGGLKVEQIKRIEVQTVPAKKEAAAQDQTQAPAQAKKDDRDPFLVLKKDKSDWLVASRFNVRAKKQEVESLLNRISGLRGEFRSDSTDLLADYGLDQDSAMTIRVFGSDEDKPSGVLLAGKEAGPGSLFVRLDGSDKVYTVDLDLRQKVGASSTDLHQGPDYKSLANLDLLDVSPSKVNRVRVKTPDTEYVLESQVPEKKDQVQDQTAAKDQPKPEEKKEPVWKLVTGNPGFELKPDGPRALAEQAFGLTAAEVVGSLDQEKPATYGLDKPNMEFQLASPDGEVTLLVGRADQDQAQGGNYYVQLKGAPQVYLVGRHRIDDLLIRQNQVFDLALWKLRPEDLSDITIDGALTLTHQDDQWNLVDSRSDETVNADRVKQLVDDLTGLSAYGPADRLDVNLQGRHLLLVEKNGNRHELVVGEKASQGNVCPTYEVGKPSPFLLEKYKADRLFPKRDELVTKKPAAPQDQAPAVLGPVQDDAVQPVVVQPDAGQTNVVQPAPVPAAPGNPNP